MNFDFKGILEQIKKAQSEMEVMKTELANKTVYGQAGGGMVNVEMAGNNRLRRVDLSNELLELNDKNMIGDLIVAAVNNAYQEVEELNKKELEKFQSFMPNIPGLNFNL